MTAYHLFANPEPARSWMRALGYEWTPPEKPLVVIEKFTDEYSDSLWAYLGKKLGAAWSADHQPSLKEFRQALDGRALILILSRVLTLRLRAGNGQVEKAARLAFPSARPGASPAQGIDQARAAMEDAFKVEVSRLIPKMQSGLSVALVGLHCE